MHATKNLSINCQSYRSLGVKKPVEKATKNAGHNKKLKGGKKGQQQQHKRRPKEQQQQKKKKKKEEEEELRSKGQMRGDLEGKSQRRWRSPKPCGRACRDPECGDRDVRCVPFAATDGSVGPEVTIECSIAQEAHGRLDAMCKQSERGEKAALVSEIKFSL